MTLKVWINGELVDEAKATVPLFDRSYLYGEGLFETLRCYKGKPAFLDRHFQRLKENAKIVDLPLPLDQKKISEAIALLVETNQLSECAIRLTLSTVGASFSVGRPKNMPTTITIYGSPLKPDYSLFETGAVIYPHPTMLNDCLTLTQVKSTSYLTKMLCRKIAGEEGAVDTILKNGQGYWTEGSRANLFIVLNGEVLTPPKSDGLLGGVTREVVLDILKEKKMPYRETHLTDEMLKKAEEVFITGSTSEVMPVRELKGMCVKKVSKDSITAKLLPIYRQAVATSLQ